MPADPERVATAVLESRRYRQVAPDLVRRLVAEELPKARSTAEVEKRVKRRLHQIFGAYAGTPPAAALLAELRQATDDAGRRAVCREALAQHASTRERLPILDDFYREIFAVTGQPQSILDLGCGLNPLALPWMDLAPGTGYLALDIDLALVAFLNEALPLFGVAGRAAAHDVIAGVPQEPCDVALLLKTLPCLEQQRSGISLELLRDLPARVIVATYPTRSLGGHGKGMARTYREAFTRLATTLDRTFTELEFPGELVFVIAGQSSAPR